MRTVASEHHESLRAKAVSKTDCALVVGEINSLREPERFNYLRVLKEISEPKHQISDRPSTASTSKCYINPSQACRMSKESAHVK